jgi:hypothetical protein
MKKLIKWLIIIVFIILLILITILILGKKRVITIFENKPDDIEEIPEPYIEDKSITLVNDVHDFYIIKNIVGRYFLYLVELNNPLASRTRL